MLNKQISIEIGVVFLLSLSLAIGTDYQEFMLLQHSGTALIALALFFIAKIYRVSLAQVRCVLVFMVLHAFAARWIYSYVPYDAWVQNLFQVSIDQVFGFSRNHFDRLVHFAFGLLFTPIAIGVGAHYSKHRRFLFAFALQFILAFSAFYELFEWVLTIVLSPDSAESYNGQQGDMWDAHKDIFMASLGSLLMILLISVQKRSIGTVSRVL